MSDGFEDTKEEDFEVPKMSDEQEIHMALKYLSKEAQKLGMPMVSHLIGAAMEAVELYDPQINYQIHTFDKAVSTEAEDFESIMDLVTDEKKVGNC